MALKLFVVLSQGVPLLRDGEPQWWFMLSSLIARKRVQICALQNAEDPDVLETQQKGALNLECGLFFLQNQTWADLPTESGKLRCQYSCHQVKVATHTGLVHKELDGNKIAQQYSAKLRLRMVPVVTAIVLRRCVHGATSHPLLYPCC